METTYDESYSKSTDAVGVTETETITKQEQILIVASIQRRNRYLKKYLKEAEEQGYKKGIDNIKPLVEEGESLLEKVLSWRVSA